MAGHRMYTTKTNQVRAIRFLEEGSHNVRMRQLIGHEDGARKTSMHELIVGKGGYSAKHGHAWDHQLVVTKGRGIAVVDRKRIPLRAGVVLLVQANEVHQFLQRGSGPLVFVTVTPI
jgi:quercetin dioxygenase-like cupin family protein